MTIIREHASIEASIRKSYNWVITIGLMISSCIVVLVNTGSIMASSRINNAVIDTTFFNGRNLSGWSASDMSYWSVADGVITGKFDKQVAKNQFLWSDVEVEDFYLCIDVMVEPEDRNAGIQFRSYKADDSGQAIGYQADAGMNYWGKLYHEHGRGKLDWTDRGLKAVKHGQWNRYEILASGHRIWTALNGTLSVAVNDPAGELKGQIALQIHGGPPQTVKYRIVELVHNPEIKLAKYNKSQLESRLREIK